MFKKFFKFLYGYVIIKVYGKGAERFINICLRRNIDVWNIKPFDDGIEMCIYIKDFFHIRQVRKKSNVKIKISQRRGIKHLMRLYRKRYLFLIGFALCIIFFAVSAQFIWVVEINGVENSDINGIISTLDSIGIKSGALKAKLPDGMESKAAIINNNNHIAWAWVYIEGAKARVEIYEQIIPPNILDKDTPCDIVAACDGIINHMVVKNGEEVLNDGDAVKTGDVIVSGKVATYKEGYPEEYIYVHSMADIMAYTTHSKNGDYKLYYESRVLTGKNRYMVSLEVFGKMFSLPLGKMNFEEYDVNETRYEICIPFFGYTGIAFDAVKYTEVNVNKEPISIETAVEFAKNDLEEKISNELLYGSTLTDEKVEYEKIDNETINVKLEMDFIQNIATSQPISADTEGEEILDKQTD